MKDTTTELAQSDEWKTRPKDFDPWHRRFHFTIDLCAAAWNHQLPRYYTKEQNCLVQSWKGERGWLQPPYSKGSIRKFLSKARWEVESNGCILVCALVPGKTAEGWYHENVLDPPDEVKARNSALLTPAYYDWRQKSFLIQWSSVTIELHMPKGRKKFDHETGATGGDSAYDASHYIIFKRPDCDL